MLINFIIRYPLKSMRGKKAARYRLICQHLTKEKMKPKMLVVSAVMANDIFSPKAVSITNVFWDNSEAILLV